MEKDDKVNPASINRAQQASDPTFELFATLPPELQQMQLFWALKEKAHSAKNLRDFFHQVGILRGTNRSFADMIDILFRDKLSVREILAPFIPHFFSVRQKTCLVSVLSGLINNAAHLKPMDKGLLDALEVYDGLIAFQERIGAIGAKRAAEMGNPQFQAQSTAARQTDLLRHISQHWQEALQTDYFDFILLAGNCFFDFQEIGEAYQVLVKDTRSLSHVKRLKYQVLFSDMERMLLEKAPIESRRELTELL